MSDIFSPALSPSAPASELANLLHKILLPYLVYQHIFQKTNDKATAILRMVESMITALPADDKEHTQADAGSSTILTPMLRSPSTPSIQLPMTITMPMDIETPELVGTLYIGSDGCAKLREGSARSDAFDDEKWTRSRKMDYRTTVDSVSGVRITRLVCTINERARPHPTQVQQSIHQLPNERETSVNLGPDLALDTVGKEDTPIAPQCELERYNEHRHRGPGESQQSNIVTYSAQKLDVRRTMQPLKRGMNIYHAPELDRLRSATRPQQTTLDIRPPQLEERREPPRNSLRNISMNASSSSASSTSTLQVHFAEHPKSYRYRSSIDISSSHHVHSADARPLQSALIKSSSPITVSKANSVSTPTMLAEPRPSPSKRKRDDDEEDDISSLEHSRKKQQFVIASDMLSGYPRSIWDGIQRLYSPYGDAESSSPGPTSAELLD